MAETWQTIEQAAVSLRLSVRTVNRHMAAGKLQSRLNDEGRREVLVTLPDSPFSDAPAADIPPIASDTPVADAQPEPAVSTSSALDTERVLALADNATQKADMAVTAYQTLARLADTQVRHVRRNARFAWAAVALMAAGVTVAVGWTTHRLTRTAAHVERLEGEITTASNLNRELSDKTDALAAKSAAAEKSLRDELVAARESAARAEGRLAAYREQDADRQTREALTASTVPEAPSIDEMLTAMRASFKTASDGILYRAEPATQPTSRPSDTTSASTHTPN